MLDIFPVIPYNYNCKEQYSQKKGFRTMTQIDRRKNYYMVYDTETANSTNDALVYDLGLAIIDKKGNVYESRSLVINEVFNDMSDLMKTAYYANKLPQYHEDIKNGSRKVVSLFRAKMIVRELCEKYNIKAIIAHNARFDYNSTAKTQRYVTKSKYRFFLPYGIELWDTLKMASDTIGKQKMYRDWCERNGYMTKHKTPRPQFKAEVLYKYISGNNDFVESHTGLEDVMIEKEIFVHCINQHKPMRKKCFG